MWLFVAMCNDHATHYKQTNICIQKKKKHNGGLVIFDIKSVMGSLFFFFYGAYWYFFGFMNHSYTNDWRWILHDFNVTCIFLLIGCFVACRILFTTLTLESYISSNVSSHLEFHLMVDSLYDFSWKLLECHKHFFFLYSCI